VREIGGEQMDELLELIWTTRETGSRSLHQILTKTGEEDAKEALKKMESCGLVLIRRGEVSLTKKGEAMARSIIRRHRLAERLFSDVLSLDDRFIHAEACKFEHILSPEVTESVCTFLGHPPLCPHGNPIPRGKCCAMFTKEVKPLITSLKELEPGEEGRITFIVPKEHTRLDKLSSLGVVPGSTVKLHQKRPSFVIRVGETDLAIDEDIAKGIYVKKSVRGYL
jgi:DtxR family Mn-dependent transcriptional regulator